MKVFFVSFSLFLFTSCSNNGDLSVEEELVSYNITDFCNKELYPPERREFTEDRIEDGCFEKAYYELELLENTIDFILKNRRTQISRSDLKEEAERIIKKIKTDLGNSFGDGKITILGRLEDISSLFIWKQDKEEFSQNLILLAVKDKIWSTDLNRDFVDCSLTKGNNFYFQNQNSETPIILLSRNDNILNEKPKNEDKTRVTHCEIEWIENLNKKNYKWSTVVQGEIFINYLKEK